MASWAELDAAEPEFAHRARALFDVHKHKTLASIRRDGSPRISGTEVSFVEDDIWLGCMPASRKARDLLRDPRMALHGPTVDPDGDWRGDVKVAGRAVEVGDDAVKAAITEQHEQDPGPFHLFRIDLAEVVVTSVSGSELLIEWWTPPDGLRSVRRR